ncbi:hypothetical protein NIES267_47200 [Calothrix parasitica NIES-267]|uniref:RRXRR domain-containing protein n=1 Tax=Calothrix parasitica NIES-267 TaxID=1973488 RepID=A0A1Z4LVQ7_9CYAN|nr:hypothetical protein NIES267_47200 [Calothrix parasitica NIES-267]
MRVPVINFDGKPLMPTKPSRARRWIKEGKAVDKWSKLNLFYVQLLKPDSGNKTQDVVVGIDPGKQFSGIAVLSQKDTTKGGKRRKYGGTVTQHGYRKGDYVEAIKADKTYRGWVSGDTKTQVSISDANWKRLGQFRVSKVKLLQRSRGLIVTFQKYKVHGE